ncbi:MAG: EXPERA domain-containing protein [Candidatus Rokuibacteriota bacterium]
MPAAASLATRDRVSIGLLLFFSAFNVTLDWALVRRGRDLPQLVGSDWAADLWALYADADRFWIASPWSLAQEGFNVFVTTLVNIVLIAGILRGAPWRHALQLALGAYVAYSCILYLLAGHLSGYAGMRARTATGFTLFYGLTLPWLAAHAWLAWDAFTAIVRRFASPRA